jgi:shikimate kinase
LVRGFGLWRRARRMRVFLVGFMGAGKTATGRELARLLRAIFWDLDTRVEASMCASVQEIFRDRGETVFRAEESRQLGLMRRYSDVVVATGGGTFASESNRDMISQQGVSVFLDVAWDDLLGRLPGKQESRPVFVAPENARLLYEARLPHYRRADLSVRPEAGEDPVAVANRLALLLENLR